MLHYNKEEIINIHLMHWQLNATGGNIKCLMKACGQVTSTYVTLS